MNSKFRAPRASAPIYPTRNGKRVRIVRKKGAPAKLSAPVRKAVTAIVKGQAETKYAFSALNSTSFNSAIASVSEWYNCLPDVKIAATDAGGSQSWQRTGTRIQPVSLKMNWAIGYNPEVSRSCDNYVVLYIFKMRRAKCFTDMKTLGDPDLFLDQAAAGKTSFAGYLQQLITPINKEQFVLVHKKIIHLQKGVGLLNNDTSDYYASNGNKSSQMVSYTMKLPKLIYDEDMPTDVLQPNNFGLVWALGYAHADAAVPDYANQDIQVVQTSELYYKDS